MGRWRACSEEQSRNPWLPDSKIGRNDVPEIDLVRSLFVLLRHAKWNSRLITSRLGPCGMRQDRTQLAEVYK